MAKHSHGILELARRGAQHRYAELKTELDSLLRHFPDLETIGRKGRQVSRSAATAIAKGGRALMDTVTTEAPKQKRKMSAKARKAIGDAQRKRWAKQKAASATGGAKTKK